MSTCSDIWIFGYGSLMWRPGFEYLESHKATLQGYHRALCIYSHLYRGTPQKPGLVLGLDQGGQCQGVVFRVAAARREDVLAYIYEREMPNETYQPMWLPVAWDDQQVSALCFVARPDHMQYAGHLDDQQKIDLLINSCGPMGTSLDYLQNTLAHLAVLDVNEPTLQRLFSAAQNKCAQRIE